MKAVTLLLALATSALAQSQDPGPSPTASIGCEPHNDHWYHTYLPTYIYIYT